MTTRQRRKAGSSGRQRSHTVAGELLRKKRGTRTQAQLAEAIGVSQAMVSQWESGRSTPSLGLLPTVAKAYGLRPEQINPRLAVQLRTVFS